jgi:hypothetical protein
VVRQSTPRIIFCSGLCLFRGNGAIAEIRCLKKKLGKSKGPSILAIFTASERWDTTYGMRGGLKRQSLGEGSRVLVVTQSSSMLEPQEFSVRNYDARIGELRSSR